MMALVFAALLAATVTQVQAAQRIDVVHMWSLWGPHNPSSVWQPSNDPDCDDNYSQFESVPQNQIMPTNNLGTNAPINFVTDGAIIYHGGLNGWFDCANGRCWVRLCNTTAPASNPWAVRLGSW